MSAITPDRRSKTTAGVGNSLPEAAKSRVLSLMPPFNDAFNGRAGRLPLGPAPEPVLPSSAFPTTRPHHVLRSDGEVGWSGTLRRQGQDGAERQPRHVGGGTEEGTEGKDLAGAGERLADRVAPGDVGRPRWQVEEAAKDEAVLRWVERFRFVTGELVAVRFGISWQRANARLRRLERMGLVAGEQQHVCEARAVFITGRGATVLGVGRRRAPRPSVQREHVLAIVALVGALERNRSDVEVLTERQCRRRERAGHGEYSIKGNDGGRHERGHWPDAAIELPWGARVAIEVELSAKAPERLRRLVEAHVTPSTYTSVPTWSARRPLRGASG